MKGRDQIDPFTIMVYHYRDVCFVYRYAQNQTAGKRFSILMLLDDRAGLNALDHIVCGNLPLCQTTPGVFWNGDLPRTVERAAVQCLSILHLPVAAISFYSRRKGIVSALFSYIFSSYSIIISLIEIFLIFSEYAYIRIS